MERSVNPCLPQNYQKASEDMTYCTQNGMNWFFDVFWHFEAWKIIILIIGIYFFDDDFN